jgi:hypothetical protein
MPLFTATDVISAINSAKVSTTGTNLVEVFTEFPSNVNKISEGIYVARVYQADRIIHSNGILAGGHIYWIKDRVEMYVVSQQVNPFVDTILNLLTGLIDSGLFQAYFQREHTIEQQYVNNSERYKVVFDLTRLQTI